MNVVAMQVGTPGAMMLHGIFSDITLAKIAAEDWTKQHSGDWRTEETEFEVRYWCGKELIVLDYWEVDRALINNEWVNLNAKQMPP
jgi:hypothetical protein